MKFKNVQDIKSRGLIKIPIDVPPPDGAVYVGVPHYWYSNNVINPLKFEPDYDEDTALINCGEYCIDVHGYKDDDGKSGFFVRAIKNSDWDNCIDELHFTLLEEAAVYAIDLAEKYL